MNLPKSGAVLCALTLCLALLAGCGAVGTVPGGPASSDGTAPGGAAAPEGTDGRLSEAAVLCRIVDSDDGSLLLAEQDGAGVYRVSARGIEATLDGKPADADVDYEEGALVEITHSGLVMETFPAQLDVIGIDLRSDGFDDLCELYLDVLDDLWEVDPGLNSGITELGVDLSATGLSESERAAVAWAFGGEHGLAPIRGTREELTEQGYITGKPLEGTGAKFFQWENGCLFSIAEQEMEGVYSLTPLTFDAQKWRSGTGAYFLADCTALQSPFGDWSDYTVGSEAIS